MLVAQGSSWVDRLTNRALVNPPRDGTWSAVSLVQPFSHWELECSAVFLYTGVTYSPGQHHWLHAPFLRLRRSIRVRRRRAIIVKSLADVALAEPINGMIELAGPEPIRQAELVRFSARLATRGIAPHLGENSARRCKSGAAEMEIETARRGLERRRDRQRQDPRQGDPHHAASILEKRANTAIRDSRIAPTPFKWVWRGGWTLKP